MSKKRKLSQRGGKAGPGNPKAKQPQQRPNKSQKSALPPQAPTIPFSPSDRILLIGEGDLSFAASLVNSHACSAVTATVLEPSKDALLEKYPHAGPHVSSIEEAPGCKVLYKVDATKMSAFTTGRGPDKKGAMDRIIFNFPHVGGKSTDVNRQVRYNQELLVSFFRRAEPSLAPGGTIVVTLFEGEPYTLWNIRDLGRHCGFQLERSFRFQAGAYPGYAHARTLGVVISRKGNVGGGWKGEERAARSYVFVRKGEEARVPVAPRKRKREGEEDGSDSVEAESSDGDAVPSCLSSDSDDDSD
ncbi:hypothetical protein VUR80DRAFT_5882 [Thermomyces stellatus]